VVVVVPTGTANLASVLAALERAGASPRLASSVDDVERADRLVLPGVGAFGAAMERLTADGLVEPLRARILGGRPTLCVCLGLQLLAEESEESPGVRGMGVAEGRVTRFPAGPWRVPQLGWNHVAGGSGYVPAGSAYYANSYCLRETPPGWVGSPSVHAGGAFVGAMERGEVVACQFHPELSASYGQAIIRGWLEGRRSGFSLEGPAVPGVRRRVIPCLDCRDGRVVKGVRFQGLRDAGDPAEQAAAYEAQGADELVVLDVSATREGRATALETVRRVRAQLSIPLTVGGGVVSVEAAGRLLDAGADKVSANTAAVRDPGLVDEIARRFGSQCAVVAIDAAAREEGWEVVITSGRERTGRDAVEWAREVASRGAGEILLTSWDRDGTRKGYDLALVLAVARAVSVPVIASGGADGPEHMAEALEAGADAVLAASIFHEGQFTVAQVKWLLLAQGQAVRP
jgi:imidazole glycerol phosphate synthase glutamine amidotransferase subunit